MNLANPSPDRLASLAALGPEPVTFPERHGIQPTSTLYGGAHRFRVGSLVKLGNAVLTAVDSYLSNDNEFAACFGMPSVASVSSLRERVRASLERTPIEDVRIDFEDGYGPRTDAEEDAHAELAGEAIAEKRVELWPARIGIRVRAFEAATAKRSLRTLAIVVDTMVARGWRPARDPFRVTLPKVTQLQELAMAARALERLETDHDLPARSFVLEAMVESPDALLDREGRVPIALWASVSRGRLAAMHFGAFDYTASLGVPARSQSLDHPSCLYVRSVIGLAAARSDLEVSDGPFLEIPIGPHRDAALGSAEDRENREVVHRAFRHHAERVRRQLAEGYPQGWDIHPAQIVSRRAAVLTSYVEGRDNVLRRLDTFLGTKAQATRTGNTFDDAASARALLAEVRRGIRLGFDDANLVAAFLDLAPEDLLHAPLLELPGKRRLAP